MIKRVSQRDLAKMAGVSAMTVSLAMRNHPSISLETRERILRLAKEHGYQPDPALAALNAYRTSSRSKTYQGTISWLTCFSTADEWRSMIHTENYFSGACERAAELGYLLDPYWVNEPGLTPKRSAQSLLARGVQGIIVSPLPDKEHSIEFDLTPFSAVALGYSLREPQLHVVMNHQARNMKHTVHHLHTLGYRRIGLAMPSASNVRVDQNYLSGYLIAQRETKEARLDSLLADSFNTEVFLDWFQREKPDAIIVSSVWISRVEEWLNQEGLEVPKDIGLAAASIPDKPTNISGIDENPPLIGRMAVDSVVGMIHRQELGIPEYPSSILAEGIWHEGKTTRRVGGG